MHISLSRCESVSERVSECVVGWHRCSAWTPCRRWPVKLSSFVLMLSCHVIRHAGTSTCCMLVYVLVCVYLYVYATPMAAADQLPLGAIVSPDARTVWRCVSSCVGALSLVCACVYLCIYILYILSSEESMTNFFHLTSCYFSAYACICMFVCVCLWGKWAKEA